MIPYHHLLVYFFSGTGNSYRAATWLAEDARTSGLAASVIPIDVARPREEISGAGQMVGLVCPTHAFTAPWAMIWFALRLPRMPRGTGTAAFAMLTRAGMKIGRSYVPGLDGAGAYLLALILTLKGYRVMGATGLDMPASWTVVMPALSPAAIDGILARARPRAARFLAWMLAGKRCFWSIIPLALGLALLPLSLVYLVMGRFYFAKLFYASEKCNGCGLCAQSCPVRAIRMRGRSPRPYWTYLCESCTRCRNFCPRGAVEASYPFAVLVYFAANIPVAAYLLDGLARWVAAAAGWRTPLVETVINYPYKLLAIAAAYVLFTLLLRVPLANRLFTLATPTHYFRRYHAPGTRLQMLKKERTLDENRTGL